jgi:hypothetical protein
MRSKKLWGDFKVNNIVEDTYKFTLLIKNNQLCLSTTMIPRKSGASLVSPLSALIYFCFKLLQPHPIQVASMCSKIEQYFDGKILINTQTITVITGNLIEKD